MAKRDPHIAAGNFTLDETRILKRVARRELGLRSAQRNGKPTRQPTSVRPDEGLWTALREWAGAQGISTTEAINRAIESLLGQIDDTDG